MHILVVSSNILLFPQSAYADTQVSWQAAHGARQRLQALMNSDLGDEALFYYIGEGTLRGPGLTVAEQAATTVETITGTLERKSDTIVMMPVYFDKLISPVKIYYVKPNYLLYFWMYFWNWTSHHRANSGAWSWILCRATSQSHNATEDISIIIINPWRLQKDRLHLTAKISSNKNGCEEGPRAKSENICFFHCNSCTSSAQARVGRLRRNFPGEFAGFQVKLSGCCCSQYTVIQCGKTWYDQIQCDTIWYCVIWYFVIRYDTL